MNRCKSIGWGLASSTSLRVIGVALVLGVIAAGSHAGGKDLPQTQFTLKVIPASAVHHGWQAPRIHNKNGTSSNWSGYAVFPKPANSSLNTTKNGKGKGSGGGKPSGGSASTFSDVVGSWFVPTVNSSTSSNTYSSTWVGLDGYSTGTVEQIGTEQDWSNDSAQYYAWFEMYPKWAYEIVGFPVNPGDEIYAKVQYTGRGAFTLTIINHSVKDAEGNPIEFSTTQRSSSAQRLSAEWVEEAPWSSSVLPLADFGTVAFSQCSATMDGLTYSIGKGLWQSDAITMETSGGTVKAQPSSLSSDGASFSVTWNHE